MDKVGDMIKDAEKMRDRYQAMLTLIENNQYNLADGVTKEEMIAKVKAAIDPLNELLMICAPKN